MEYLADIIFFAICFLVVGSIFYWTYKEHPSTKTDRFLKKYNFVYQGYVRDREKYRLRAKFYVDGEDGVWKSTDGYIIIDTFHLMTGHKEPWADNSEDQLKQKAEQFMIFHNEKNKNKLIEEECKRKLYGRLKDFQDEAQRNGHVEQADNIWSSLEFVSKE